ncbi:MAG: TlyA family RNA methyltransferase [Firmicutes bacterium]|nr:TlyA family RNA methyltransferase [Bacillota bacterium]
MKKIRLDLLLVKNNLAPSREKARSLIMTGNVFVNGKKKEKPGDLVSCDSEIYIKSSNPFVSRGGLKLKHALDTFKISVDGKVVMDVGASTGGFTDCLLQYGAAQVIAVEVGYGQLAWSLRNDCRVVLMEKTNVKYITEKKLPPHIDMATVDVSFISVLKVLPVLDKLDIKELIVLIKPQFEAGPKKVGKKGVVKNPQVHLEVLENVINNASCYKLQKLTFSPIKGPKGNIEFLAHFKKYGVQLENNIQRRVVEDAHKYFQKPH